VTGIAALPPNLSEQKLTMLKAVGPGLTRVAWLVNPSQPGLERGRAGWATFAPQMGVQIQEWAVREPDELARVFAAMAREGVEALFVMADGLFFRHCPQIAALAATHRLPAVYGSRACVEAGGLMSYAADEPALYRRAGVMVGKILQGAQPAALPVEQAMKFEFVVNLKAAKALGVTMPPSLLVFADEVIQ
jgi:putative ABC transport system substrate-binding protein